MISAVSEDSSSFFNVEVCAYLEFLTNNLEMNSLASSVMTSKLSSSKSHSTAVTFARVSLSSSPSSGDRPLSLYAEKIQYYCMPTISVRKALSTITKKQTSYFRHYHF